MEYKTIKIEFVDLLGSIFPSDVNVATVGSKDQIDPPEAIIDVSSRFNELDTPRPTRIPIEGEDGVVVELERQEYYNAEVSITLRSENESSLDQYISMLSSEFTKIQDNPDRFHEDTMQWGGITVNPSVNIGFTPQWYENEVILTFTYVRRITEPVDAIEEIDDTVID